VSRLLTASAAALLAICLSGCGDRDPDGGARDFPGQSGPASAATGDELPADLPTEDTDPPDVTDPGEDVHPTGDGIDGCELLDDDLVVATFGVDPGDSVSGEGSIGDATSTDCIHLGGPLTVIIQPTTHADRDLPASTYEHGQYAESVEVPGADRGLAYIADPVIGAGAVGVVVVVGQRAVNVTVTPESGTVDCAIVDLQNLGTALADALG
jgi:hypothetical protein